MNFFGIKEAWVRNVRANFRGVWALYELVTKRNKIWLRFIFLKKCAILFFWLELLVCHLITKFCMHLAYLSIFDAKMFHVFWNFFAIFSNLLFTDVHIYSFCLPRAAWMSKHPEILHGSCAPEYLRCCKISDFFIFIFCYFFDFIVHWFTVHPGLKPPEAARGTKTIRFW